MEKWLLTFYTMGPSRYENGVILSQNEVNPLLKLGFTFLKKWGLAFRKIGLKLPRNRVHPFKFQV